MRVNRSSDAIKTIVMWSICLVIVFMRDAYLYHVKVDFHLSFHFCRYIQGAQFFGNPNITPDSTVPNDNGQNLSQTIVINSKSPAIATTLRARFIGQGYKQVIDTLDHDLIISIPNASSLTSIIVIDVNLWILSISSIHKYPTVKEIVRRILISSSISGLWAGGCVGWWGCSWNVSSFGGGTEH